MCDSFLFLFLISCGLQRKWAENNNNVLKYVTAEVEKKNGRTSNGRAVKRFETFEIDKLAVMGFSRRQRVHELQPVLWTL